MLSRLPALAAGTLAIFGNSMKTTAPMMKRMTAGSTVQISSSRVLPCTCAPSTSRLRPRLRYLTTNTMSTASTITKIAAVKPKIT